MTKMAWGKTFTADTSGTDPAPGPLPNPVPVTPAPGSVITVGPGEMYQTLTAALEYAGNGATILVDAGTYTDDFATVSTSVTIIGVGGIANFVADTAPTNEKGILTVDADARIENCSFSGAAVSDANGGNGAGLRYEGGQLVLENDSFVANQDGLLAFPTIAGLTNTIVVDHCLFDSNGSGTGYTHNVYVGNVTSFTFTNNISQGVVVGHELKSRAFVNDIEGNVFQDGVSGTASYEIDLPNGGACLVAGNLLEKGANASNSAFLHFGGEGVPYAGSSLLVTGNVFQNDYGDDAIGVLNQTATSVTISGDVFSNFGSSVIVQGPAVATSNTDGSGAALPDQTLTGILPGSTLIITDSAAHTISLSGTLLAVEGGGGLLTVNAVAGHVVAYGGSGGMIYTEAASSGGNTITTLAGARDTIATQGMDLIDSEGTDSLAIGPANVVAVLGGTSTVTDGSGNDQFSVSGTTVITGQGGSPVVMVGATGSATVSGPLAYLHVQDNGGAFSFNITQGGAVEALSGTGGIDVQVYNGAMNVVTAGGQTGAVLRLGAGAATVTSLGADAIYAGSGAATVILEGAADLYAGTGALSIYGRSDVLGADVYGAAGTYTIAGDTGNITYHGGASASTVQAVLSAISLIGGAGRLTVIGGSRDVMTGGTGGLVYAATDGGGANTITTLAGAKDSLTLAGADVVMSCGTDTINAGTGNQVIAAYGSATINGSTGNSMLTFGGTDVLNGSGYDQCTVLAGAALTANAGTLISITETAAWVRLNVRSGTTASVTVSGGAATLWGGTAAAGITVATASGTRTNVTLSGGVSTVVSNGTDSITALAGTNTVRLQGGADTVTCGGGTMAITDTDMNSADTQTIIGGKGGITLANGGIGGIAFLGGSGSATLTGGAGQLYITGGSGLLNVTAGSGGCLISAGSGALVASLSSSGGTIAFGSASAAVQEAGYGTADFYNFLAGQGGGIDTIAGFRIGTDRLSYGGVSVKSERVTATSTNLVLTDSTRIVLTGVFDTGHVLSGG